MTLMLRLLWADFCEAAAMFVADHLPKRAVYWTAVRLMTHAATHVSNADRDVLTPSDCLELWKKQ